MIYQIDFSEKAKADIAFFQKSGNLPVLKKISALIKEIAQHPFTGTGKPEQLKYRLSGNWSRRINHEDRLVYEIEKDKILIHSLRGHYS